MDARAIILRQAPQSVRELLLYLHGSRAAYVANKTSPELKEAAALAFSLAVVADGSNFSAFGDATDLPGAVAYVRSQV